MSLSYRDENGNEQTIAGTPYDMLQKLDESTTYSTDEIVVGKWINGKPIYRKVITFTTDSSIASTATQYRFDTGIANSVIDELVEMNAYLRYTNSNGKGWASNSWNVSNANTFDSVLLECGSPSSQTMKLLCYIAGAHFASQPLILVLEYTKTTD